jgi:hypothetical protein
LTSVVVNDPAIRANAGSGDEPIPCPRQRSAKSRRRNRPRPKKPGHPDHPSGGHERRGCNAIVRTALVLASSATLISHLREILS